MGYEAAFLGCPVVFINLIADPDKGGADTTESLSTFAHQYHVQRYLVGDYPSCINNLSEITNVLKIAIEHPENLAAYNSYVSGNTPLLDLPTVTKEILKLFQ
jgi:hypothetical protein